MTARMEAQMSQERPCNTETLPTLPAQAVVCSQHLLPLLHRPTPAIRKAAIQNPPNPAPSTAPVDSQLPTLPARWFSPLPSLPGTNIPLCGISLCAQNGAEPSHAVLLLLFIILAGGTIASSPFYR